MERLANKPFQVVHSRVGSSLTCKHQTRLERLASKPFQVVHSRVGSSLPRKHQTRMERLASEPFQVLRSQVVSSLTRKHQTKLERFVPDDHSSSLQTFVNDDRKKFYGIGPCRGRMTEETGRMENRDLGSYSQHFIFFATYESAQSVRVFVTGKTFQLCYRPVWLNGPIHNL
jgi:hypothetical protein